MKFSEFAGYLEEIEKTSSRLQITHLLAELFRKLSAHEMDKSLYLMQGRVAPLYEAVEFGIAEKMVARSAVLAMNLEKKYFDDYFKKIGDIGQAVEHFKKQYSSFEAKDLSILEVFDDLRKITVQSGSGSQEAKINILAHLIRQLDPLSCRYLVRIPLGMLRLGFSDMTVLDAFSWMLNKDKTLRKEIEEVYHVLPDIGHLGKALKADGEKALKKTKPRLFIPILMMRAERLSSGKEIIEKIGRGAVEPKYDGFRLQIHFRRDKTAKSKEQREEVRLYSRNLEDVTYMYPDLVKGVKKEIKADEIICEGEAIGFDPYSGNFLPFQETVQRKRKHDIEEKAKEIPLKLFIFELLYLNGESMLHKPFQERRRRLAPLVKETGDVFKDNVLIAADEIIDDPKLLDKMFDEAIAKGLEGVVVKKLDGIYQAGARGSNWIKFKRSYSSKIEDTIDCLVMGYDFGKGKRTGFGIGAFLAGIYDEKNDVFLSVAKIGTGLTDEEWREMKAKSQKLKVKSKPALYKVDKLMDVDVWVSPRIVVEIKADELTKSPIHSARYALRFPRLERFRDDKRPEDVTTLKEYEKMYHSQKK